MKAEVICHQFTLNDRSQLIKDWTTFSTGSIATQWISVDKTNHAICKMAIYPMIELQLYQPFEQPRPEQ